MPAKKNIPQYDLKNFRKAHRQDDAVSSFGHNQPDPTKTISGFELYSGEGIARVTGPLKSNFYRISIVVTGTLDMQIGLDHYPNQPQTLAFTFPGQVFLETKHFKGRFGLLYIVHRRFLT